MTSLAAVPDKPDTSALSAESRQLVTRAESLSVIDAASYAAAAEFGKGVKALRAEIDRKMDPNIARWNEGHKAALADKHVLTDVLDQAERIVKGKMLDFQRAERARLADEQRRREEQARKLDEERRLQEALDREAEGDHAGADEALKEPPHAPIAALPQPPTPKIAGVATPRRWTYDETKLDVAATIKHIVGVPPGHQIAHPELLRAICHDTKVLRQLITAMKENFNLPGVVAYEADSVSLGSK